LIGPVLSNGFALYGIPLMNKAYEHVTFLWAYIFRGFFFQFSHEWICVFDVDEFAFDDDVLCALFHCQLKVFAAGMFWPQSPKNRIIVN
jgi:hypothetical protein